MKKKLYKSYNILVGTPEEKKPFRRPMFKWAFNIKTDLKEMGYKYTECIQMVQDIVT
jgi:predicted enzyme related to lactoylglutathione lyase